MYLGKDCRNFHGDKKVEWSEGYVHQNSEMKNFFFPKEERLWSNNGHLLYDEVKAVWHRGMNSKEKFSGKSREFLVPIIKFTERGEETSLFPKGIQSNTFFVSSSFVPFNANLLSQVLTFPSCFLFEYFPYPTNFFLYSF